MTTRSVANEYQLSQLLTYLSNRKLPFSVEITEGRNRSAEANRLAFKWYVEISDQTGEDREDVRARCKLRFGLPILMDSSEAYRDLCRRRIKPLSHAERIELVRDFDIPITRLMTVPQMSQYLDQVFRHHAGFGIVLTIPEDRYAFSPKIERNAA